MNKTDQVHLAAPLAEGTERSDAIGVQASEPQQEKQG